MALRITRTAKTPTTEPVTLNEAKAYLRVLYTSEDTSITALITQARQYLESAISQSIVATEITLVSDVKFKSFRLPYGPVTAITSATLDGEDVLADFSDVGYIEAAGTDLEVIYEAGPAQLAGLKQAVLELVALWYTTRGGGSNKIVSPMWSDVVKGFIQMNNQGWFI